MDPILARIDDASRTSETRRLARRLAVEVGFNETDAEKVAIVVTEACTNVLKHAGEGLMSIKAFIDSKGPEIEVLALDSGPGFSDLLASARDGYSTAGTPGNGLGAIRRLSSFCDIYSVPQRGTAVLARVRPGSTAASNGALRTGAIQMAKPGEDVCGDACSITDVRDGILIAVADGLGHGPDAARASRAAMQTAAKYQDRSPGEILEAMDGALRPTRGAAVAVAALDGERRIITYAGLGNISGCVCAADSPARHLISMNGTAGLQARHIREYQYPWPERTVVVLHSDGIRTRWDLREYPGLLTHDPSIIAGMLYRDYYRGTDDATVVAAR